MMQHDERNAAVPPTVEKQIESLRSEPRAAKTSLGRALAERDHNAAFDRCMVGGESCKRKAIRAHCIPETALELIADESRKVIAAHSAPPRTAVQWLAEDPLKEMSISSFNAARWSCRPHDDTFGPLDTKQLIDLSDRNLFLLIYKITVYLAHRALHVGERLAVPMLDPGTETPQGLSAGTTAYLEENARTVSLSAMGVWRLKLSMDRMFEHEDFSRFEYRAARWRTSPAVAAVGMAFLDGPGSQSGWSDEDSLLPAWVALLPQEHGHTIVTASPRVTSGHSHEIHEGMPRRRGKRVGGDDAWTRLLCDKLLAICSDLAVSRERFAQLSTHERDALQGFLARRSVLGADRPDLPNLLNKR